MLTGSQIQKVCAVFRDNYQPIPLHIFTTPYKVLISTLLSSRTKDEVTLAVCKRLFEQADSLSELAGLRVIEVEKLLYPVGFYKRKARYLLELAQKVIDKYNGEVPLTRDGLMSLPGVGRKTTNLVLQRLGIEEAIAVDTHVHRISNLLGWVDTKTPEQTEIELMKVLPKRYWHEINDLFVSIGQQYRNQTKLIEFLTSHHLI